MRNIVKNKLKFVKVIPENLSTLFCGYGVEQHQAGADHCMKTNDVGTHKSETKNTSSASRPRLEAIFYVHHCMKVVKWQ